MRKMKIVMPILFVGLAMVMGCAKLPQSEIDAAKAALQAASDAGAADYAAAALRDAQNEVASLDAEVAAQAKKFALMRSYKQAATLAAEAKAAGEKAAADAAAGKERTKGEAEALLAQAKATAYEAAAALASAPAGKGTKNDIDAMAADMATVAQAIADGEAAHGAGRYLESKAKFEAALGQANNIAVAIDQAKAAVAAASKHPQFPPYVPAGAQFTQIPDSLVFVKDRASLKAVWQYLEDILTHAGFDDRSTYCVDSTGFAIVCRLERITDEGYSAKPRWAEPKDAFGREVSVLAQSPPGRYREIILVVSPHPPAVGDKELTPWEMRELRRRGAASLPLASMVVAGHKCFAYVYEFLRPNGAEWPILVEGLTVTQHVIRAGLWTGHQLGKAEAGE